MACWFNLTFHLIVAHLHKTWRNVVHTRVPFGQALAAPVHSPSVGQSSCLCSALFVLWSSSETTLGSASCKERGGWGVSMLILIDKKRSLFCTQHLQTQSNAQNQMQSSRVADPILWWTVVQERQKNILKKGPNIFFQHENSFHTSWSHFCH